MNAFGLSPATQQVVYDPPILISVGTSGKAFAFIELVVAPHTNHVDTTPHAVDNPPIQSSSPNRHQEYANKQYLLFCHPFQSRSLVFRRRCHGRLLVSAPTYTNTVVELP
jgi:hypothetical protein